MANGFGAGGRGAAQTRRPQNLVFEEIVPSSGWTEESDSYCLIIDLPGFKKDKVNLQVDDYGHLIVSGERQVDEMKHVRFQQSYKMPDKSNVEDTTAKFEDDVLYIVIPKKTTQGVVEDDGEKTNNSQTDHHEEENKQNEASDQDEVPDPAKIRGNNSTEKEVAEEEAREEERQNGEFHDAWTENHQWNEGSLLGTLKVQLIKNKGIFVTAILAFSLGVLVSQKFQTSQEQISSPYSV